MAAATTPAVIETKNLPGNLSGSVSGPGIAPVMVAGNRLEVFTEAPSMFLSMLQDIADAKSRIWVETYIFANDASGTAIAEALSRRAHDGLDVKLLYDAVGSQATPLDFFARMNEAGVQVHAYHNFWEATRRFSPLSFLNRRDHRKLLVIDDVCAYFGGMNIIDHGRDFRFLHVDDEKAPSTGWRDLHVRLAGPQQSELVESFQRSWSRAKGLFVPRRPAKYRRAKLSASGESIHFFDSGPGLKFSRVSRVYRRLLRGARYNVVIAMAYFIPVGRMMLALNRLRRHNVRVQVIVPAKSDVRIAKYATFYLYQKLLRLDVSIYERTSRMMHTKLVVIDRQWTIMGSANMDPRSFYTNLEFIAVIRSEQFAAIARKIASHEIRHSRRVRLTDTIRQSLPQRILIWLAWNLRWWL